MSLLIKTNSKNAVAIFGKIYAAVLTAKLRLEDQLKLDHIKESQMLTDIYKEDLKDVLEIKALLESAKTDANFQE